MNGHDRLKSWTNPGKVSFWLGRGLSWISKMVQPFNFFMLLYLSLHQEPLAWLMFPIGIGVVLALFELDNKFVYTPECNYVFDTSPRYVELQQDIKEIKETLRKVADRA